MVLRCILPIAALLMLSSCFRLGFNDSPDASTPDVPSSVDGSSGELALDLPAALDRGADLGVDLPSQDLLPPDLPPSDLLVPDQSQPPDTASGPKVVTFTHTGALQTFVVPPGVNSVVIKAWGAVGAGAAAGPQTTAAAAAASYGPRSA